MDELKKLLGHPSAPQYMLLLVLFAWFMIWIAVMPGKQKFDCPHRHHASGARRAGRAVATVEDGAEAAEKPARKSRGNRGSKGSKAQ